MKKIALFTLVLFLTAGSVFAANNNGQNGIHEPGTGINNNSELEETIQIQANGQQNGVKIEVEAEPLGNGQGSPVNNGQNTVNVENKVKNMGEDKQIREQEQLNLNQGNGEQNQVRATVQNLLMLKEYVGADFGKQVSEIAQNFNNSIDKTSQLENKIQNRNGFARFFLGGDKDSAEEINNEIEQNRVQLEHLKTILEGCDCAEQAKEIIQEQIQQVEQEQVRLEEIVQEEVKSNGIFGWITKLFK